MAREDSAPDANGAHWMDPIIEVCKSRVDRAQIRENLKLTPDQRLAKLEVLAAEAEESQRAADAAERRRMSDTSPLLLLTSRRTSRHQTVYGGICANDHFESGLFEDGWDGHLLGREPVAIRLVHHQVECCHLNTGRGSYWMSDGIQLSADSNEQESLSSLARNGFGNLKFTPPREVELPCFVAGNPDLRPCRYEMLARVIPSSLLGIPDARVELEMMESLFPLIRDFHTKQRNELESARLFSGLALPVELNQAIRTAAGVLHLRSEIEPGVFRCMLYWSDNAVRPEPGTVLRRRARRDLQFKGYRHEGDIAEVLTILDVGTLRPEAMNEGIVTAAEDGHVLPIICTQCGGQFDPVQFTPEQLEVIDLWGWLWPLEKERSLLVKAHAVYRRYPEAKGNIASKFDAIMHSDAASRKMLTENLTFGEMRDPRAADYQRKLDRWTGGDRELRDFFEHSSCDVERRLEFVNDAASKWEGRLLNRIVVCPACGGGPVALKDSDGS